MKKMAHSVKKSNDDKESTQSTFHRRQSRKTFKRKSVRSKCNMCVQFNASIVWFSVSSHSFTHSLSLFIRWFIFVHVSLLLHGAHYTHSRPSCTCVLIKYLHLSEFAVCVIFQPSLKSMFMQFYINIHI